MPNKNLTPDQQIVYNLIANPHNLYGRITQLEICRSAAWLGSHPVHEKHLNIDHEQSTLRKIREIIRSMRLLKGIMILSDTKGYWIMKDPKEAIEYCHRIEKTAKAQARAYQLTYQAMKANFHINSEYFERQGEFNFD